MHFYLRLQTLKIKRCACYTSFSCFSFLMAEMAFSTFLMFSSDSDSEEDSVSDEFSEDSGMLATNTVLELLGCYCLVLTKSLSISSIFSTEDFFLLTFKLVPGFNSENWIIGLSCLKGLCFSFVRGLLSSFSSILSNWLPMEFRYWLV
jgi:hypothetical protein